MTLFFLLAVASFANWRICHMIGYEEGPRGIFGRLRARLGVMYRADGTTYGTGNLSRGIICMNCTSFWMAIPVSLLAFNIDSIPLGIVVWLAVSTGAIAVDRFLMD